MNRMENFPKKRRTKKEKVPRDNMTPNKREAPPRKTKRKVLDSQAREIISKIYDFMKKEAVANYAEKLTDARWRTAQAAGVSEKTVTRIRKEKKDNEGSENPFPSPMKKRRTEPRKINLEHFDIGTVRRTIQNFHRENKRLPTLLELKRILANTRINFDGCLNTLRTLLMKIGYRWRVIDNNKKSLSEKHNIQMQRLKYLKQIKLLRSSGRPIIYTDEAYLRTNPNFTIPVPVPSTATGPEENKTEQHKIVKGQIKVVVIHAGGYAGFIPNAMLVLKDDPKVNTERVTANTYLMWLQNQLLPNLPYNAVVVMDNAPHHNAMEDIPSATANKNDIISWLLTKNIPHDSNCSKVELYDLVLKNKDKYKSCRVDDMIRRYGFEILKLPPHHPELNPITNIWDILKNYMAYLPAPQTYESVVSSLYDKMSQISGEIWSSTCRIVEKIEDEYMQYLDTDFKQK